MERMYNKIYLNTIYVQSMFVIYVKVYTFELKEWSLFHIKYSGFHEQSWIYKYLK